MKIVDGTIMAMEESVPNANRSYVTGFNGTKKTRDYDCLTLLIRSPAMIAVHRVYI